MYYLEVPCKAYVKRYLETKFGNPVKLDERSITGKYFYKLVDRQERRHDFNYSGYSASVQMVVSKDVALRLGDSLTKTSLMDFNNFVADQFKLEARLTLYHLTTFGSLRFVDACEKVYQLFNQDRDTLPFETLKKDYQRHGYAVIS